MRLDAARLTGPLPSTTGQRTRPAAARRVEAIQRGLEPISTVAALAESLAREAGLPRALHASIGPLRTAYARRLLELDAAHGAGRTGGDARPPADRIGPRP
jgi:hypothetical protein